MPGDIPIIHAGPEPQELALHVLSEGEGEERIVNCPNGPFDVMLFDFGATIEPAYIRAVQDLGLQTQTTPHGKAVPEPWAHNIDPNSSDIQLENGEFTDGLDGWTVGGSPEWAAGTVYLQTRDGVEDYIEQRLPRAVPAGSNTTIVLVSPTRKGVIRYYLNGVKVGEVRYDAVGTYTSSPAGGEFDTVRIESITDAGYTGFTVESIVLGIEGGSGVPDMPLVAFRVPRLQNQGEILEEDGGSVYGPLAARRDFGRLKIGLAASTTSASILRPSIAHRRRVSVEADDFLPGIEVGEVPTPVSLVAAPAEEVVPVGLGDNAMWLLQNTTAVDITARFVPRTRDDELSRNDGPLFGFYEQSPLPYHEVVIPALKTVVVQISGGVLDATREPRVSGSPVNVLRDPELTRGLGFWNLGTVSPQSGFVTLWNRSRTDKMFICQTLRRRIDDFDGYTVSIDAEKSVKVVVTAVWYNETNDLTEIQTIAVLEGGPGTISAACAGSASGFQRCAVSFESGSILPATKVARFRNPSLYSGLASEYNCGAIVFPGGSPAEGAVRVARLDCPW